VVIEKFAEMAKAAGAEVETPGNLVEAISFIKEYLGKAGLDGALISPDLKNRNPFDKEFFDLETKLCGRNLWVEAGIVAADYGLAETGTLVHLDRSDEEKNAWTLPEVCFCFLEQEKIVPSAEAIESLISGHLSRTDVSSPQVSFITGPSRTADIECRLTIGVHGPSRLVILIVP
jgi:L-lactate dehydrogenase complex protein LldG